MKMSHIACLTAALALAAGTALAGPPAEGNPPSQAQWGWHDDKEQPENDVAHFAVLSGGNEIGPDGKAGAGAEEGSGSATVFVDPEGGQICFGLAVDDVDTPIAAHIHKGQAGYNGPVVVTLTAPASGEPGAASGCIAPIDKKLLRALHDKPWQYYVNVHTVKYPDGAVRGQLF